MPEVIRAGDRILQERFVRRNQNSTLGKRRKKTLFVLCGQVFEKSIKQFLQERLLQFSGSGLIFPIGGVPRMNKFELFTVFEGKLAGEYNRKLTQTWWTTLAKYR